MSLILTSPILTLAIRSRKDKAAAYDAIVRDFNDHARALNRRVLDGEITVNMWHNAMREQVKVAHVNAYAAGRSGGWAAITAAEWGSVGNRLRRQYQYLARFADELKYKDLTIGQINARAGLYGAASRASFEAAIAAEKGVPASALPAMPGDGSTLCRTNCKCSWAIRKRGPSHFATWRLGRAEHCRTCTQRSRQWKNLEIRDGALITPLEPIYAT